MNDDSTTDDEGNTKDYVNKLFDSSPEKTEDAVVEEYDPPEDGKKTAKKKPTKKKPTKKKPAKKKSAVSKEEVSKEETEEET